MEVLDVPAAMVGKLIGKSGETIRKLQLQTDTRIQVDHAGEGDADDNDEQDQLDQRQPGLTVTLNTHIQLPPPR